MRRTVYWLIGTFVALGLIGSGVLYYNWSNAWIIDYPTPPIAEMAPDYEIEPSTVVTPLKIPIGEVQRRLERDLPSTLLEIDQRVEQCIPRETVRLFGANLFETPRLGCNLVGQIRRGSISLQGSGRTLSATLPVMAEIEVRDIGDIVKRETATATAVIEVRARLGVSSDWRLQPNIRISYRWLEEPQVVVLGQRIKLTKFADREFAKVRRSVEKELEDKIRQVDIRSEVASTWRSGFETLSVNRENPPVWLRFTPKQAGVGELRIQERQITTNLMIQSDLEVFLGEEPEKPTPTDLEPNMQVSGDQGFQVTVPVLADYGELEPVILRALKRLADKGISVEELGELEVDFEGVTLYATDNGRIAVGVEAVVAPVGNITGRIWGRSRGKVWLTANPVTEPGSEVVSLSNLEIFGDMDSNVGDLLVLVIQSSEVKEEIERELVEDFKDEYDEVIGKAREGIRSLKVGGFDLSFTIDNVEHGKVIATSKGLFMPVSANGGVTTKVKLQ